MKNDLVFLNYIKEFCDDLQNYLYEIKDFDELKNNYPQIPWREIKGLRNRLIHAYFGIDYDLIWGRL